MTYLRGHKSELFSVAIFVGVIVIAAAVLSGVTVLKIQPVSGQLAVQNISFPIAELGNCASESDCRNYCNDSAHIDACVSFAQSHGLMTSGEASQAKQFSELLQSGQTPGNCKSKDECETYCSDMTHMEVCISFAQKMGINDEHIKQGEKILAYLKSGGTMPGGCSSKETCEAYCGNVDHSDECLNFLEGSGMGVPPDAVGPDGKPMTFDQLKKIMALMKSGESPGGCKGKTECEDYCKDQSHFDACVDFAVKAGFMSAEQADLAKKTGGKGPGGCSSEDSCKAYCNDSTHQQECFAFAKDHGLIPADQLQKMQQGIENLKKNLNQAPPDVLSCIESSVGPNVIQDIMAGKLMPGPEIGDQLQTCFEKFKGEMEQNNQGGVSGPVDQNGHPDFEQAWNNFPTEVQDCLKQSLGADKIQAILQGNGSADDMTAIPQAVQTCMRQTQQNAASPAPTSNAPAPSPLTGEAPQDYCPSFASVPNCSYVGSPDSQDYQYCKQCFPDK